MARYIILLLVMLPMLAFSQRDWSQMHVKTTEIAPGLYRLFVGEGVAVVAWTGDDGLLIIDAAYEQTAPQLVQALAEISPGSVDYLINTHIHGDHTGGNVILGKDADIIAHHFVRDYLSTERKQGDRIIPPMPDHAIPNITFSDDMMLVFNGQALQLKHLPGGHTGGDIIIYFPQSKVLVAGDLLFADNFPFVDVNNGGHPFVFLENLAWIINHFPADLTIIGGHGPVYTMAEFINYRETLLQTLEVVREAKANGMSLEQMKASRIMQSWEEMGKGFISEDRWIETLYPFL
jgi:cyclase